MRFIIDKLESKYAICEMYTEDPFAGEIMDIDIARIPYEAQEGDVIILENDIIAVDEVETARRKAIEYKLTEES